MTPGTMQPAPLKRSTLLRGIAAGTLAGTALAPIRTGAQTPPKLRVAAIPIDISGVSYYALDQGFYAKYGLDVDVVTMANGAVVAAAVAGGALDVGSGNTIAIATAHEHGIPFKLIAPSGAFNKDDPTDGIVVAGTSLFKTAKDLAGKIFGIAGLRNISEVYTRAWLDQNGVDNRSVKFVELTFPEMAATLASGRVDAVCPEEPALTAVLAAGGRIIARPGEAIAPIWTEGGFFCTESFIQSHPDAVKKLVSAFHDASVWANNNRPASLAILAKYSQSTLVPTHRCYYPERLDARQLQPLINAAAKYGILKSAFPASDLFAAGV
jgi:NitT/TauT family transport system substrate-binding protein